MDILLKKQLLILIGICLSFYSLNSAAKSEANLNKAGVILDGYDAVSYFKEGKDIKPTKGKAEFAVKQDATTYWFSTQKNKEAFLKDSQKYEPQFGGWCAYAVADSKEKVEVDPESFIIQDGRLLVFYKAIWANTRDKWLNTKDKDSKTYLKQADANWTEVKSKDP